MEANTCKNCGEFSEGHFCPNCGQRMSVYKVTFKETFQDFMDVVFSVNAPLFITLKGLLIQPGKILRDYLNGHRKKYYKPVSFFILTTVLYLVIRSLIGFDPFKDTSIKVTDDVGSKLLTEGRNYMLLNINNLLFIFVFTLALFSKVFFFNRYLLAEFVATSFYFVGIYTLFITFNMFLVQYVSLSMQPFAIVVVMCLYFLFAMTSFLERPKPIILFKSFILFFLAFISYFLLGFGLSVLIVYSKQM